MPVRSLRSSVLKWPGGEAVLGALREWAAGRKGGDPSVVSIGYFGSLARGTWGDGSDVDVVVVVRESAEPFERRRMGGTALGLPVPADVLVYTLPEWDRVKERFAREIVWLET